jgi:hypothetical protein
MADILAFPSARAAKVVPDSVWIVRDFGRWCAATYSGERLIRRFPSDPNTFDAVHALAKDMAAREGLRFAEMKRGPANIQPSEAADV